VWYSIKKHWCLEAQRLVRAERMRPRTQNAERIPVPDENASRSETGTESAAR